MFDMFMNSKATHKASGITFKGVYDFFVSKRVKAHLKPQEEAKED